MFNSRPQSPHQNKGIQQQETDCSTVKGSYYQQLKSTQQPSTGASSQNNNSSLVSDIEKQKEIYQNESFYQINESREGSKSYSSQGSQKEKSSSKSDYALSSNSESGLDNKVDCKNIQTN